MSKKRVIVAMSGGVDSAVTAYLLKKEGYEVEGVTMQLSAEADHIQRSKIIAAMLEIPHEVLEIKKEFKEKVINYFCDEYIAGRTPNPCLRCNRFIKFGLLMNSLKTRADYFATGHYASVIYDKKEKKYKVQKGKDFKKEQSYVLFMLNQKQLSRILLPLGKFTKEQVRRIAKKLKLPVKDSDESQDICFIKDKDHIGFITKEVVDYKLNPGEIVNSHGDVLGHHNGRIRYTIGQRKGLGIANKVPLFVTGFDNIKNRVIVGTEDELYADTFELQEVFFTHPGYEKNEFQSLVKIRYHHRAALAKVTALSNGKWRVKFKKPQKAITPGQGAVFYKGNTLLGGGLIAKIINK